MGKSRGFETLCAYVDIRQLRPHNDLRLLLHLAPFAQSVPKSSPNACFDRSSACGGNHARADDALEGRRRHREGANKGDAPHCGYTNYVRKSATERKLQLILTSTYGYGTSASTVLVEEIRADTTETYDCCAHCAGAAHNPTVRPTATRAASTPHGNAPRRSR